MISGIIVLKKNNGGFYTYAYHNKEPKDLLLTITHIMSEYPGSAQVIIDFLNEGEIDDSLGFIEFYSIELKDKESVSIIYYDSKIEKEIIRIERAKLIKILNQWIEITKRQPSEIIILQNDNDLELKGVFPLGECPIVPYVLYRKNKYGYSLTSLPYYVDIKELEFIYLLIDQFYIDENIFTNLIHFLKDNSSKELSLKLFLINIYNEKIIFTDISKSDPARFFPTQPNKEYELNKIHFINLLIDIDNAIKMNAQEIIISLKEDNGYKVEASYEPLEEEFPKYRCYP